MIYVTDTHSLIWYLAEDKKLSKKAKEVFEKADQGETVIVIPTIVLAELFYLCEKKKIIDNFLEIIEKISKSTNYVTYDLDLNVIIECRNLNEIREMHDKIITATAIIIGARLITKDEQIFRANYVETIW